MASPTAPSLEDFHDLTARVAQLERILRAQAAYQAELLSFAPTTAIRPGDQEIEFSIQEAADYLGLGKSTFMRRRDELGLAIGKPGVRVVGGKFPRYSKPALDRARDRM
jgi:hypothetical protein